MTGSLFFNPAPFGKLIYSGCGWYCGADGILITIDDSPQATTPRTLDLLERFSIRALFFCTGENSDENPELLKDILNAGHSIGNHSYSHTNLRNLSRSACLSELSRANETIENITGSRPRWFRPPYGKLSHGIVKAASALGMKTVMWSLLTGDYKNDLKNTKLSFRYLRNNSIVVFHDNPGSAAILEDSLAAFVEVVRQNSFRILTPEECLRSK